jgi:multiple sugar transport system substrate-binding protein
MKKHLQILLGLLIVGSVLLAACGGAGGQTGGGETGGETGGEEASGPVTIRWFVGLGTGTNPEQVAAQEEAVAAFNESHDNIELVLEIVPYDSAVDTLSTQIASGAGPDVIGPVGWGGSNAFYGQWLDMTDAIAATGYDTSQFSEALVNFYVTDEGQVGLPFAVFPAATFFVPALFDEAGLNYPPTEYGQPYVWAGPCAADAGGAEGDEAEWSYETVAAVAKCLTVDVNGNNSYSADFDRDQIAQVGYDPQFQAPSHMGAFFGAGQYHNEAGEAHVPDSYRQAWEFFYNGIWGEQPFIANGAMTGSPEFGAGNPFNSGRVAMGVTHLWYTCCLNEFRDAGNEFQLGVLPSNNGEVHGRVDADTFRIWKGTAHPNEAFEVVAYLVGEGSLPLLTVYGALPAREADQATFLAAKTEQYPFVTSWDPILAGLAYPDVPSGEGYMPHYNEAWNRIGVLGDLMRNDGTIDLAAEIAQLEADLTAIFQSE